MRSFSFADVLKRALPFFAALVVGVFIASFFVDLSGPRFGRGWKGKTCHKAKMLRLENEELKNENLRLQNEIENLQMEFRGSGLGGAKEEVFRELNTNDEGVNHRLRGKGNGFGSSSGSGSSTR